jgi:rod shape determining protein RodA
VLSYRISKGTDFIRSLPQHQRRSFLANPWQWLHIDPVLLGIVLSIIAFGLCVLYSASTADMATVLRQALRMAMGLGVMLMLAQLPPAFYRRWTPFVFGFGVVLLVLVLVMGIDAKGATRWLQLPGLPRFQPSEIMKLAVPLMVAWYLGDRVRPPKPKPVIASILLIFIPAALVAKQPDLGTALLIGAAGFMVLFLSGLSYWYLLSLLALSIPAGIVMWYGFMHQYQKQRVLTFLDPEREPLGHGWNIIQSKIAIGSGGIEGKGWLKGTQSHLDFLPESSTDFIIAVLAEEWGFIGMASLIGLYVLMVYRGAFIAMRAQDAFSQLLAGGIVFTWFVYVFVNIGMVSGILPVVGVPLPFVSYGGTSAVTLMASIGILMSIHTHRRLLVG